MALINPVHGLVVPFLCVWTIPLAIFAGVTTTLAFSVLMFRVAIVYLDIALGLLPHYFATNRSRVLPSRSASSQCALSRGGYRTPISPPSSVGSGSGYTTPTGQPAYLFAGRSLVSGRKSPAYHRRHNSYGFSSALRHSRQSSQVSLTSYGAITPINEDDVQPVMTLESGGLTPSVGLDRDFEGVGGWRLDDQEDDRDWTNINSRLELPVGHHHQRSQSLGPTSPVERVSRTTKSTYPRSNHSPDRERVQPGKPASVSGARRHNQHTQLPPTITTLARERENA